MVDAVNTVSLQSATQRPLSQGAVASAPVAPSAPAQGEFVTSHIRVDNLQNVAILEYLSSSTGEVIRQYPSQGQINAFKRAEQLQEQKQQAASSTSGQPSPAPQVAVVEVPAPSTDAGHADSASTQSVLA